jgi:cell division cycle protein 20 (cofactor of APC complex)
LSIHDQLNINYKLAAKNCETTKLSRYISATPEKILDAPALKDDYYLNLMDWGDNGILAVSLDQSVYLWNSYNGEIQLLL